MRIREFVNPRLKAGRVPLGRTAIVVQIIGAMIFLGYTLAKKDVKLPFSPAGYQVEIIFPDAKGLDPADGPAAAVAGSPAGKVTQVHYTDGRAAVTVELNSDVKGKIFADASAAIRPASALQNLLVNIDPGSPSAGPLPDHQPIEPQRTSDFVAIDELTSVFDADTQAYLQIVISEAQRALHGRAGELRSSLARLGRLTGTAAPVATALARRRELLTRLVGDLDTILGTLAVRGDQLGTAVDAGSRTLEVTARRSNQLRAAIGQLAPALGEARRSLAATRGVTEPLAPALQRLAPAAHFLSPAAAKLRALVPPTGRFLSQVDALSRDGRLPVDLFLQGTQGLAKKAQDLIPAAKDIGYRADLLDKYKGGAAQFGDVLSGAFSVSDSAGNYGQIDLLKPEALRPENFGLPATAMRSQNGSPSRLESLLATALERSCQTQSPYACLLRFGIPELPHQPLTTSGVKP
ncbi:MAG: phospholipid/cholesterol/gamma-HCH transport system substrate-binding protein [Solirubrobacterales bacterium]|jgi:phospholipid/cholesterol/gamma-HCH transport system substrate-binding protein|nr:phospholipid/cholesterol/gamma-HCH transport system substrate-binding protein [Solirubrobacterales bacterium]